MATIGVAATLAAQLSMGDSWRIGVDETERTALVTGGAFKLVRNPIFSAMLLTAVELAPMVPNVLAVVGLAALVVALELQVRWVEEPYLDTAHGQTYAVPMHQTVVELAWPSDWPSTGPWMDRLGRARQPVAPT